MSNELKKLTAEIVTAYVGNTVLGGVGIHGLITSVYHALANIEVGPVQAEPHGHPLQHEHNQTPAVDPKKSVFQTHIVCLEDGLEFKTIKRHLQTSHGMTPAEYRQKWGLPHDYPVVAPGYAKVRSKLAMDAGLGKKSA